MKFIHGMTQRRALRANVSQATAELCSCSNENTATLIIEELVYRLWLQHTAKTQVETARKVLQHSGGSLLAGWSLRQVQH
jgi:hypothetical protein